MEIIVKTPVLDLVKERIAEWVNENPRKKVKTVSINTSLARDIIHEVPNVIPYHNLELDFSEVQSLLSAELGYPAKIFQKLNHHEDDEDSDDVRVDFELTIAETLTHKIDVTLDHGRSIRYVRTNIHEWADLITLEDRNGIEVRRYDYVKCFQFTEQTPSIFKYRGVPIVLAGSDHERKLKTQQGNLQ